MHTRAALVALVALASSSAVACTHEVGDDASEESELTSNTALARELSFQGKVFVRAGASDQEVESAVKSQTQTAFGPLRTSEIAVNSRELKGVDPGTFRKRPVKVVDPTVSLDAATDMLEVTYTYKDDAVVAKRYARRTRAPIALMSPDYRQHAERVLRECTPNDAHAREFSGTLWYVFEPSVPSCRTAMETEARKIDSDRLRLRDARTQVPKSEVSRLYLPVTAKLGADKTNKGQSYPEYDRLYTGGVEPGKLVIGLVYGMLDHDRTGGPETDYGYSQYLDNYREVMTELPALKITKIEPQASLDNIRLASGKQVSLDLRGLIDLEDGGGPANLSYTEKGELKKLAGQVLYKHWITAEAPVKVKIGTAAEKTVTIKILSYFGAESDSAPHKVAIKNSDVFIYNGHSYIGFGPLDPSRFTAADFPPSYQILFVDGCVSYNYYEKDYIPLKSGGTRNLDLITNGLEAPSYRSGYALGRFVATLVNGKQASYRELLTSASSTEALRVVDGEVDNKWSPTATPILVRK